MSSPIPEIDAERLERALEYYNCDAYRTAPHFREIITAARAHLATLPRWKEVEVWHVEYTVWAHEEGWLPRVEVCGDAVIAEARALKMRGLNGKSCIRVTGPHMQKVPA